MDNEPTNVYESHPSVIPYAVIGVIVGGLIGVFVGMNINPSSKTTEVSTNNDTNSDYQAGFEAARAKMIARGMIMDPALIGETETTYINGTVKAVSGNALTIEVVPLDPLADNIERPVTITANTELYRLVNKDQATFQTEMEAFNTKMQNADTATGNTLEFPQPFTKEKITITDIKAGDIVNINATANITPTGNIEAVSVEAQTVQNLVPEIETPSLPVVPPTAN